MNPSKEEKIMKKSNGINNILGPVFLKLIDHSWKSKFNEYTPEKMHQILKNLMKGDYNTQNPGLIYKYILSQLHSELCPNELNNGNIEKDPYLKYNEDKVFEDFQKNYQNTKISNCLDPEEAWSTVFSKWLEKHRDYTIVRIGKKGLIVKDVDGKVFELLVDYKKLDSVH